MIASRVLELRVQNFKAFERFRAQIPHQAVLVGPNNAGKSTLISALRAGARVLSTALARRPTEVRGHRTRNLLAYPIPRSLDLDTTNIRHEFRDREVCIELITSRRNRVTLVWPPESDDESPFAYLEPADTPQPTRPKQAQGLYPALGIIPVLTPLERNEGSLADEYVRASYELPVTSRHFRNHLARLRSDAALDDFLDFAGPWAPEIEIRLVRTQIVPEGSQVDVFYAERGFKAEKEIAWLGDGMQIWLQLLFHIYRLRDSDVIILDEPDVYLHADLKRRLVRLLESLGNQFILASHSSEVLTELDQGAILYVDRGQRTAMRAKNPERLDAVSRSIGTSFNLRIAKALRARLLLFVEGQDLRVITLVAQRLGFSALAAEQNLAPVPIGGFDAWREARGVTEFLSELLDRGLPTYTILDRDYRSEAERKRVMRSLRSDTSDAHIWKRKELESYLLEPELVAATTKLAVDEVVETLRAATDAVREEAFGGFVQERQRERGRAVSAGTVATEVLGEFDSNWSDLQWRLRRGPAKKIVSAFNSIAQSPINPRTLARNASDSTIDPEFASVLEHINGFLD